MPNFPSETKRAYEEAAAEMFVLKEPKSSVHGPTDSQQQVRVQLAATLQGVICQNLVPKIGGGRVAAREILVATDAVRSLIREAKSAQILNLMQTGRQHGMVTLEDELLRCYGEGLVTSDDAVAKANRPDDVRRRIGDVQVKAAPPGSPVAARPAASPAASPAPVAHTPVSPGAGGFSTVQGLKMRAPTAR